MEKFKEGDKVYFFADIPEESDAWCGEGIITSILPEGDNNDAILWIEGFGDYAEDEIFASWEDVAKAACNRLKQVYKDYE